MRQMTVVNFGLGPLPEVHLAYMRQGTPFDTDVHYVPKLEEGVIARNKDRGERTPTEAITIGHKTYEHARYIQVLCFGSEKAASLARALYAEVSPQIVATGLRRPGLGQVEYFVDRAAFAISATRS
jgi:6-phosphogluconolactonase/glucosamine-6-phosphate isomerase/deaminase